MYHVHEIELVELTEDALAAVAGGHGSVIDPNGSEADAGYDIDPNG
jgi:hypothetical protein